MEKDYMMFKALIAGATALWLACMPASAQGFDEDQIGQFIFGLFATVAIASIIKDNKHHESLDRADPEYVTSVPHHATPLHGRRKLLPKRCVNTFQTDQGRVRLFTRNCISRHHIHTVNFPYHCERDVMTNQGFRSGWAVWCMRNKGFLVDH